MKDHAIRTAALATLVVLASACGTYTTTDHYRARDTNRANGSSTAQDKELVCHKGKKTLSLPASAVQAHLAHGDHRGSC